MDHFKINETPVKLINKTGANICWWNAFAQLFSTTRNKLIINGCRKFVNEHDEAGDDNNHHDKNNMFCGNCKIMNNLITMMTNSQNSTIIDFNNYLFRVPPPVQDSKKQNQSINHAFSIFQTNMQNDAY